MSLTAQSIIRRVVETLQDPTSIRWPVSELVRYLNDGQRELILYRPDAASAYATRALSVGTRQTLPDDGSKLLDVVRNSTGSKRPISLVDRVILDAQVPSWHSLTGTTEILHYMYDPREPREFYVYPPASAGASVELSYTAYPVDVAEPADGSTYTAVTGNLGLPDIYGNVIQDYILYRAYMKDSEYAGNAQRAQAHYASFANALGIEVKATVSVAPSPTGNPNAQARSSR